MLDCQHCMKNVQTTKATTWHCHHDVRISAEAEHLLLCFPTPKLRALFKQRAGHTCRTFNLSQAMLACTNARGLTLVPTLTGLTSIGRSPIVVGIHQ